MTDAPQHAPLPPSSAARWVQCGRSPSLEAAFPNHESEEAREGTAAHWVLAEMLQGREAYAEDLTDAGYVVDADMIEAAMVLRDHIESFEGAHTALAVEQRVHMTAVHPTDNWGTCDAFLVDRPNRTIYIWDYKYGHGYVPEVGNWQMIDYAQGVIEAEGLAPGAFDVVMTIYQPRYYGPEGQLRSHRITGAEHAKLVNTLHLAAKLVSPNAAAVTGPECINCRGRAACDAAQRAGGHMMDVSLQTTPDLPTGAAAGRELTSLRYAMAFLKGRLTGLEALVDAQTAAGEMTGYVREQGYGREKWTVPPEEVFAMGDLMGLDLRKPSDAITPNQAVKLGLDPEVKSAYSVKPKGAVTLVPLNKSRIAAAFAKE